MDHVPNDQIADIWTCQRPDCDLTSTCACCRRRNRPGHEAAWHKKFIPAVDPTGGVMICGDCALQLIASGPSLTLRLEIPAAEALSR
jgi:hypothetical protein